MNILIVGSGGREHALAWKIAQSPLCKHLYAAPGNPGIAELATCLQASADDFQALGQACVTHGIDLVVVGPEGPLVSGIRDYFENDPQLQHILLVGPGKSGARLEGSKDFSKQFMVRNGIPTARARTFQESELADAMNYLEDCALPIVLKADGLAAGKGVIIAATKDEARQALQEMLGEKKFGAASARVLIEEFLDGIELSVFVLTDGADYVLLPEAKDYKRIGDNDTGLNTGGMGAISPVPFADADFMKKVEDRIIRPTIEGLRKESIPYRGFIFAGLIRVGGEPYVIEYNSRMGDPETQAVMPRIKNDFTALLAATARGTLKGMHIEQEAATTAAIVMTAEGYPGSYRKGDAITLPKGGGALVFQAGTRRAGAQIVTDGGRVMAVTGSGSTIAEATKKAYEAISAIHWNGVYFRKDIGVDLQKFTN